MPNIKIIEPVGRLDSIKGNELRRDINDILTGENTPVDILLIDLKGVTFMDSSGLSSLVSAQRMIRAANGKLFLCSINTQIKMVFELTKMERVFNTYTSREAFHKEMG